MRPESLARVMIGVAVVGTGLLAWALFIWVGFEAGLGEDRSDLLPFLACLFVGVILNGLGQSWLFFFALGSNRTLPASQTFGFGHGLTYGLIGFASDLAVLLAILLAATSRDPGGYTTEALAVIVPVQLALAFLEWKWVASFALRSAAAEEASV